MFCSKCGCQLNDAAVFCHMCGSKVNLPVAQEKPVPTQADNRELNRDALEIYLHDVLALECIKNKYTTKLNQLNAELATPYEYFEKKYNWANSCFPMYFLYWGGKHHILVYSDSYYGTYVYHESEPELSLPYSRWERFYSRWSGKCFYMDIEANYNLLTKFSTWTCSGVNPGTSLLRKRYFANERRDLFIKSYNDFKSIATSEMNKKIDARNSLREYHKGITAEFDTVSDLLAKEYELNIIPSNFRNLAAVYYLYDFIKTSNQSFTTALMHFDLQEIKSKLDTIIQQNQEIIIQQAILISQNETIIQQNQECLHRLSDLQDTASNIEYNTAEAAKYASIAANNAKACAFIGLANYLKD